MKYFIVFVLASATAARLDNVYLPASSGSSGGSNAGLQTPFESGSGTENFGSGGQNFGSASQINQATILKYDNQIDEQGYHYSYETSDGTKVEQDGRVIPGAVPEEGSLQVAGSYSYIGDDGQTYTVTYTADENGFRAEGAHLPTPPPIPEAILRSLQLTAGSQGLYDRKINSYDADAGY
ncbi:endocuticle structural glycoprotein SgAbd-2-like [Galleria mellonella]|uniref:Endocuticle structural glycoprotein SgAbd-2-like n=1 Tax=Galleria mellonella TaxID=7137 RepID=A0ABM3MWS9_GALME|nr:endocuticle structural glycoprotein SgAbd-2-like [Galleria mellonella]